MEDVQMRNNLYGLEFREPDLRRAEEGERKTYNIKQLWQRSHEIVNLAARGFKQTEIAEILNCTPQCVSDTLNSELGQKKLSDIRLERDEEAKKVSEKIRVITNKALQTYHEFFDDPGQELTLKDKREGARDFLNDISGLRAPTRNVNFSASTTLTPEELEEFKRLAIDEAHRSGMVIDVEVKEVSS